MEKELVVVIDFGGQYNQLVARRVRECNVLQIYSTSAVPEESENAMYIARSTLTRQT